METTWAAPGRRTRTPGRMLAEGAGIGGLIAALVLTWSDGTPSPAASPAVPVPVAFSASEAGFAGAAHVRTPVAPPAPPQEPPVPTSVPVMIIIPSLNVHRPIEPVGIGRGGAMVVTQNLWNAGWYRFGPVPGAPGDAVIEGHAGYPTAPLLFGRLSRLRPGAQIVVVLADGSRRVFRVDSAAIWPAGTSPPGMAQPYGPPSLTLITCTGPFDDHYKTYSDRLAVQASYAGLG